MRPVDLFQQTAFRLAIGITAVIFAVLMVAGVLGYGLVSRELVVRQDARINEIIAALQQSIADGDRQDLIEAVQARIDASKDGSTVYALGDRGGKILASNFPDTWTKPGWFSIDARALGIDADDTYRIFGGDFGAYRLVVGLSNIEIHEVGEIVAVALGWATLFALLAIIASAGLIAAGVQKRITIVEQVLGRVAKGDLAARLPVTKRRDDVDRIALAINSALHRLAVQVDAMRQVSTDIAHDLRTPLNRLRIRIEQAADLQAKGQMVANELADALKETDQIAETFAALLRIGQIEAGARRERFTRVDVSEVMANVVEAYIEVAEDVGMTLTAKMVPHANINGDRELLTQMFANLIENVIRHCPAGTAIQCQIAQAADRIILDLRDNGPGIPEDERENCLRRLYRLEKSRTTDGSGLGLALVKAVVDLHDGTLTLKDANPGLMVAVGFARA